VRFRHVLRCREGDVNQPNPERRSHSHANHLPSGQFGLRGIIKRSWCYIPITLNDQRSKR
jgi:hypothetical protein